jgi:predicted PurR-regulated permease PerM
MDEYSSSMPLSDSGGWSRSRVIFLSISGALTLILLIAVREVLLPFILAVIIAYVLTPLVAFGERKLRLPRSLSILLVYFVVLGTLSLSVMSVAPRLYDESVKFVRDVPRMAQQLAEQEGPRLEKWVRFLRSKTPVQIKSAEPGVLLKSTQDGYQLEMGRGLLIVEADDGVYRVLSDEPRRPDFNAKALVDDGVERFIRYAQLNALQFLKVGQTILTSLSRGTFLVFMTLMVAGYLMHTRESVLGFFKGLAPRRARPGFDLLIERIDRGLSGVVRGQLLICLVNGVLSAIGFALFGLKYWPLLAVMAGLMSIIPIFGSILSSVPAVIIGLSQDFWTAFWILIWILAIHQIEANLLNPKIIGVAAKIHPVLVVFALLVGEHFFGLWGALLAVPVLSLGQSIFNHFRFGLPDVEPDSLFLNPRMRRRSMPGG